MRRLIGEVLYVAGLLTAALIIGILLAELAMRVQ